MSYLPEVVYHAQKLELHCRQFQTNESQTDTLAIEQSYQKAMHYINLEREVSGDGAMEQLYDQLPSHLVSALAYAEFLVTSLPDSDLIEH